MTTITKVKLASIELDPSIQCREKINQGVVNDYAADMMDGGKFPPVVLFGTEKRCWPGDGWHRITAARQLLDMVDPAYIASDGIDADLRPGGRLDALKFALGANAVHGMRRTNGDKARCVKLAVEQFPELSNVAIGGLCGVSDMMVATYRSVSIKNLEPEKRTGSDGKQYPAHRKPTAPVVEQEIFAKAVKAMTADTESAKKEPAKIQMTEALGIATFVICHLERIREADPEREEAFAEVVGWITQATVGTKPAKKHGRHTDWRKLTVLAGMVKAVVKKMQTLKVDVEHKVPARTLCESFAEQFNTLAQKLVR